MAAQQEIPVCPFCRRPAIHLKKHHLVPRSKGGKGPGSTVGSCLACHRAVHALFSNKELAERYNTVRTLMANERFRKQIAWIAKQDPTKKLKVRRAADQRKRGKYR